jgi:hypothetical protein
VQTAEKLIVFSRSLSLAGLQQQANGDREQIMHRIDLHTRKTTGRQVQEKR